METSNFGANHAVSHAQNDRRGLGTIETCNSGLNVALLQAKTTNEGWDPYRLVILMLITFFSCTKRQVRSGTHRDL